MKHVEIIDPENLLRAYCLGIFPMADSKTGEIKWYEPLRRAVFPLDGIKISRSLRRTIRKKVFEIKFDTCFEEIMRKCAQRSETWISETIVNSYIRLFELGFAHSVEAWREKQLVGGLYGVSIGGAFFGESMFSIEADASKTAFVALTDRLHEQGYLLLDAQFMTDHLASLGAVEIAEKNYLKKLKSAIQIQCTFKEALV